MANVLKSNTWFIDTASATPIKGASGTQVLVSALEFSGYAASTDKAVVKGNDGKGGTPYIITTLQGNTTLSPISTNFGKPVWMMDLAVTTLSSGQVTVYVA